MAAAAHSRYRRSAGIYQLVDSFAAGSTFVESEFDLEYIVAASLELIVAAVAAIVVVAAADTVGAYAVCFVAAAISYSVASYAAAAH